MGRPAIDILLDGHAGVPVRAATAIRMSGSCSELYTTAIDSYALFGMCQSILEGTRSKEEMRVLIEKGLPILASVGGKD
jgi:hypothetical protein